VGGKTGVDTPAGKNLIGAFLQPRLVVADIDVLRTLALPELRAGMAEAIKHGAIADADYFGWMRPSLGDESPSADFLTQLVVRSVQIKAEVVGRDERESGPRKMLNFGHTVGHAVESLSGFRLLHGEAIAIGMVVEGTIGERLGVTAPGTTAVLREVIAAAGLPTRVPAEYAPERIVEATRSDKKARAGRVEYSLIERIGAASAGPDGRWAWGVEDEDVVRALRAHYEE
jgi:3-dehydroquinate synthase